MSSIFLNLIMKNKLKIKEKWELLSKYIVFDKINLLFWYNIL